MNGKSGKTALVFLLVTLAVVLVFGGMALGLYGYMNDLRSTGIAFETGLNAQYLDNQNELSNYVSSFYEQVGVANLKSGKIDQILKDAVSGRYDNKNGMPVLGKGSPFFAAIVEAYPDLSHNLDIYDKIVSFVSAGREAYKAKQSKLLDQVRAYDSWRKDGIVQHRIVSGWLGFPSDALEARIGKNVVHGQAALDQMKLIVTTSSTKKAYENGEMEPLRVPKD